MSSRVSLVTLSLVLVSVVAGCGGSSVFVREGAQPIDLAKEKILVLPADTYGFGGVIDETMAMGALIAGTQTAFGSSAVDLNPLKPVFDAAGLQTMSYRLAYGVYHCIDFHQSYSLDDGCGQGIEEVPTAIAKLVGMAMEKLGMSPAPTYIFALCVISEGESLPGVLKYRVVATIYDTEKKLVHSCVYYTATTAKDAMLVEMNNIPGAAFGKLMEKAAAPKPAEEPAK